MSRACVTALNDVWIEIGKTQGTQETQELMFCTRVWTDSPSPEHNYQLSFNCGNNIYIYFLVIQNICLCVNK